MMAKQPTNQRGKESYLSSYPALQNTPTHRYMYANGTLQKQDDIYQYINLW